MSNFESKREEKFHKQIQKQMEKKKKKNSELLNKKDLDELTINNGKRFVSKKEIKQINNENYEIVKDNRLIQKATYDFTRLELQALNFTLSKLDPKKVYTDNDVIQYPLKDLYTILGIKENSTGQIELLKESLHNLRTKGKWVRIEDEKEKRLVDLSFFLYVDIKLNDNNENIVRVRFMQDILNYLQNLKGNFTKELVIFTMRLKSKYAIRLYELCKSYQSMFLSKYKNNEYNFYGFAFIIEYMKNKWCLPSNYTNGDIKRILDKAIKEINEKTDIEISIEDTIKENKKIIEYIIKIIPNKNFTDIYKDIEKEREYKIMDYVDKDNVMHLDPINDKGD